MARAKREPYTKIGITIPDRLLEALDALPGGAASRSFKIEMLIERGLQMGVFMTPEQAREIFTDRALQIIKTTSLQQQPQEKKKKA